MGYHKPNYTQVPNALLDKHMKDMTKAELKIILVVVRKTIGWHKKRDRISLSQLTNATGLSKQSCIAGVQQLIGKGLIERYACDDGFEYELVQNLDYQETKVVQNLDQLLVQNLDPQKKVLKEIKPTKEKKDVLDWYVDNQRPSTETAHDGSWFPIDVKKYLNPFTVCFKRRYKREATKSERGYWIRECREWSVRGYDYKQVPDAFQLCIDRDITIKSPRSITWAFDQLSAEDGEFLAKEM